MSDIREQILDIIIGDISDAPLDTQQFVRKNKQYKADEIMQLITAEKDKLVNSIIADLQIDHDGKARSISVAKVLAVLEAAKQPHPDKEEEGEKS